MKKLLPLLLCLALCLSLSVPALAANSISRPAPTPTPSPTPAPDPVADFCAEHGLTLADLLEIYEETVAALHTPELDAMYYSPNFDPNEYAAAEDAAIQTVADAHGLTYQDIMQIQYWAVLGKLSAFDPSAVTLKRGELLDVQTNYRILIVKAKITPVYNLRLDIDKELTVYQNYQNAWHIIHEFAGQEFPFDELQYWAVADMTDGSEGKVISFTVPAPIIAHILAAPYDYADIDLAAAVSDLWILPSLR